MKRFLWLLAVFTLGMLVVGTALAQSQPPAGPSDDEVNAVAKQMYCPVCENVPLDVCPTQACAEWRELIRLKLSEGWDAAQIKAYFAEQYGDRVLAQPPARGLNWLVYILPPIAILIGVYVLYRAFRTWKRPLPQEISAEVTSPVNGDPYIAKLEEELKSRQ